MNKTNIVFIHKGDSWYLKYSIRQVIKSNPEARLFLLGNEENYFYRRYVDHLSLTDFFAEAEKFSNFYRHLSFANFEYELFCIQRWFILLEFMKSNNLENCLLVDTDVLIFEDVSKYLDYLPWDGFHFSQGTSNPMGFVYVSQRVHLQKLCDFIMQLYIEKVNVLEDVFNDWKIRNQVGGVSDITLFLLYESENKGCFFNFEENVINNSVFCFSLNSSLFKRNSKGNVEINWRKGIPYVNKFGDGDVVLIGVHCFGLQKQYMRLLYHGPYKIISKFIFYWKSSKMKMFLKNFIKD